MPLPESLTDTSTVSFSRQRCSNRDLTRVLRSIGHRIHCVRHEVQYYLLQVDWIGPHLQGPLDGVYAQVNIAPVGLGRKKLHCIGNHFLDVALLNITLALEQVPQVPDDIHREAIGLPDVGHDLFQLANFWRVCPEQVLRLFQH